MLVANQLGSVKPSVTAQQSTTTFFTSTPSLGDIRMESSSMEQANKAHILEGPVLSEIIKRAFQSGEIYMAVDGQMVLREAGVKTQVIRNMNFGVHVIFFCVIINMMTYLVKLSEVAT